MKSNIKAFTIFTVALLTISSFSFANNNIGEAANEEKVINKAREAVESASPDDWYTYAKAAKSCFAKKVNLKEAAEWIDQSIEIKETAFNLEIKGDYYAMNRLPRKALEYYTKAAQVGKSEDFNFDTSGLQKKIAKITGI